MTQQAITVKEAASRLEVAEKTVRRWISSGKLGAIQPGAGCAVRIPLEEWQRFLKRNQYHSKCAYPGGNL